MLVRKLPKFVRRGRLKKPRQPSPTTPPTSASPSTTSYGLGSSPPASRRALRPADTHGSIKTMSLETVVLDHLPSRYTVHLALFRGVQNASFLHGQLLSRNAEFEYGFVDAAVVSPPHVHAPTIAVLSRVMYRSFHASIFCLPSSRLSPMQPTAL